MTSRHHLVSCHLADDMLPGPSAMTDCYNKIQWRGAAATTLCYDVMPLPRRCAVTWCRCHDVVLWRGVAATTLCYDVVPLPRRYAMTWCHCHDVVLWRGACGLRSTEVPYSDSHLYWNMLKNITVGIRHCQSIHQSTGRSIHPSINQPINYSIYRLINALIDS